MVTATNSGNRKRNPNQGPHYMSSSAQVNGQNVPKSDIRLAVAVPVKVISDEVGIAPQWSCTYEVSSRGARLKQVRGVFTPGQEIWIKRNDNKARFRVTWIGEAKSPDAGLFAAECMDDILIWDDEISDRLKEQ